MARFTLLRLILVGLSLVGRVHCGPGDELTTDGNARYADSDRLRNNYALCNTAGFALVMEGDGNLNLYDIGGGVGHQRLLWTPGVFAAASRILLLVNDGELILFDDSGHVTWRNNFHGPTNTIYRAFMTFTGDFVVVNGNGILVWNTNTHFYQSVEVRSQDENERATVPENWPNYVEPAENERKGCTGWHSYFKKQHH